MLVIFLLSLLPNIMQYLVSDSFPSLTLWPSQSPNLPSLLFNQDAMKSEIYRNNSNTIFNLQNNIIQFISIISSIELKKSNKIHFIHECLNVYCKFLSRMFYICYLYQINKSQNLVYSCFWDVLYIYDFCYLFNI